MRNFSYAAVLGLAGCFPAGINPLTADDLIPELNAPISTGTTIVLSDDCMEEEGAASASGQAAAGDLTGGTGTDYMPMECEDE